MHISVKREYLWSDRQDRHIILRDVRRPFFGQIASVKGASDQQTSIANGQQDFYKTLSANYNQQFANQNAILGTLQKSLNPIVQGGPNQFGFSKAETNNLNSQALQGTGQQFRNASKSLGEAQAAQGGGNSYLPTGAQAQQQATLAATGANQTSNQLMDIQAQGYQQGRNQYNAAIGQLGGVAGMFDPNGVAGAANTGGSDAFGSATKVAEMNNEASPWNLVGGLLGGAASAGLDAFTGGIGGSLATSVTCPAKGSLILTSDGLEKPIECLVAGDQIMGIDDELQTIEEIQQEELETIVVTTDNGTTTHNSLIHAFALPRGGFVVAAKSLGKTILTAKGPSEVIKIVPAGKAEIFNMITDGSHTYRADGAWALGQGEGERAIDTSTWKKVNHRLSTGIATNDN